MLSLYWPLFSDLSIAPVPSADFTFLQKNLEKFRASIGRERVDAYLLYCYESLLSPFLALEAANDMKNHDLLDAIYFQVERGDLPGKELLLLEVQIARAYYERDYEQAFSLLEEHIALFPDTKLWTLTSSFQSIRMESKEQIARVARLGDKITGAIKDPELKEYLRAYFNIYKRLAATGVYWEDLSLEEALGQANARDIFLFVNCYQEGAAATMADTLFAQEHIGEFFNQHFVNLKIDMTKEAGASIGEQYRVKKFPTFLLFRPDGILHYKLTGVQDEATFIERIQAGLSGEDTAWDREQQYEEGERDPALIAALIASLLEDKPEEAAVVARDYMTALPDSARCDSLNWYIYEHPRLSPLGGDLFTYLLDHQGAFAGSVGKARVDSTIHARYMDKCTGILSGKEPLEEVELVNLALPLKYASTYRELAATLEITKAFCARQGSEEEHLRGLFNACRRRVGNLSGEIAYRVGRPVLGYLAQHIDQTHLGEYNMLVNTFAKKIADAEQKSVLKSMVIPLPTD
jgi:hypothetical protein